MKLLNRRTGSALALSLSGALWMSAQTAQAQNAVTPSTEGRFQVELRDASLADALEMIFKAAGNPPHQIDALAQTTNIGFVTFPSIRFDTLLLNLTRANNFRVAKDQTGTYIITPRTPPPVEFSGEGNPEGAPPSAFSGFPAPPNGNNGVPTNPFGRRGFVDQQISPFGRSGGGSSASADKQYRPIRVLHLSASGIAQLFGGTIITTEDFLGISSTSGGGGSGGGSGGFGGGFGGSGFGASSIGGGSSGGGDSGGLGGGSTGGGDVGGGGGFSGGGVGGDTGGSNGVGF